MTIRRQKIKLSFKTLILNICAGSFLAAFSCIQVSAFGMVQDNQDTSPTKTLPPFDTQPKDTTITLIRALDKITARITEVELPEGLEIRFGALAIRARTCKSRPPEEQPETFAYLEIDDVKRGDERVRLFNGWMLASSPALNPLEHPVYDVWVISCKTVSAVETSPND